MPFFSIITICYNAEDEIVRTIESVKNQICLDYEYIIIDGKSKDMKCDIVQTYKDVFGNKCIFISEPDTGIYNAMNKGIDKAIGNWMIFLNAGDTLFDKHILGKVKKFLKENSDTQILYGDVICKYKNLYKKIECLEIEKICEKMIFCHQSSLIRKDIMKLYKYNENYKISADYDFFLRAYLDGLRFRYIKLNVSVFALGGISSSGAQRLLEEYIEIRYKNKVINEAEHRRLLEVLYINSKRNKIRNIIKRIMPNIVIEFVRRYKLRKDGYIYNLNP